MIASVKGSTSDLWAQLQDAAAGYDFRQSSPLTNLGTGGSALDGALGGGAASPTHVLGTGYTFDGGDQINVTDSALLDFDTGEVGTVFVTGAITVGATLMLVAKRSTSAITAGQPAGWLIFVDNLGRVRVIASDATNAGVQSLTSSTVTSGQRFVAAARIGASTVQAYLNGSTAGSSTASRPTTMANAEQMRFGRLSGSGTTGTLVGTLAQGMVVRREMTDAEIAYQSALLLTAS